MCLSFITYYPKIDLGKLNSSTIEEKSWINFAFRELNKTIKSHSLSLQSVVTRWFQFKSSSATSVFMGSTAWTWLTLKTWFCTAKKSLIIDCHQSKISFFQMRLKTPTTSFTSSTKIPCWVSSSQLLNLSSTHESTISDKLVINDPVEFHDRSFMSHLHQLPWEDSSYASQLELLMTTGRYMLFCRIANDSIRAPTEIIKYPSYVKKEKEDSKACPYHSDYYSDLYSSTSTRHFKNSLRIILISVLLIIKRNFNLSIV